MNNLLKVQKKPYQASVPNTGEQPECRRCHSTSCERISRGPMVKTLFTWLPLKHYICLRCLQDFYVIDK